MAGDSSLGDWSETIQKQGQQHALEREQQLEAMRAELPVKIGELPGLEHDGLLDVLLAASTGGSMWFPEEQELWQQYAAAARAEVLRRMGRA